MTKKTKNGDKTGTENPDDTLISTGTDGPVYPN